VHFKKKCENVGSKFENFEKYLLKRDVFASKTGKNGPKVGKKFSKKKNFFWSNSNKKSFVLQTKFFFFFFDQKKDDP